MLDDRHQNRHGRVLMLPVQKRVDGANSSQVLERDVDFQPGELVNELDQGNSSVGDNLDGIRIGDTLRDEEFLELVQPALCAKVRRGSAFHKARGADDQVHVGSRQVQAGHEGAKRFDLGTGKVPTIASHCFPEIVHQVVTNGLLEITWPHVLVKVDDFFVQARNGLGCRSLCALGCKLTGKPCHW